jgi:acyl carrier protein
LNQPERTAEKFIPDAFSSNRGARLYETGDLCRYLANGDIEFLRRIDQQVKIRGFRVEPGEIEAVLRRHPDVREAAVIAREEESGEKRLVAYVVPEQARSPAIDDLRRFLSRKLPRYMEPSAFVSMRALPLTPNGKVDYRSLPSPGQPIPAPGSTSMKARSPLEEVLVGIWAEVLGTDRVSANDDFFKLGGHSLSAIKVISRLRRDLGVELPLRSIFEGPTIAELATAIERMKSSGAEPQPSAMGRVSREAHRAKRSSLPRSADGSATKREKRV